MTLLTFIIIVFVLCVIGLFLGIAFKGKKKIIPFIFSIFFALIIIALIIIIIKLRVNNVEVAIDDSLSDAWCMIKDYLHHISCD